MQGFLPPGLLAGTPLPVANPTPSARAAVPHGDNTFSRQLEQSRQRARESARPTPQAAAQPAPPPPAARANAPAKPPEPPRSEAQRSPTTRTARDGDAANKAESTAAERDGEADTIDRTDDANTTSATPTDALAPTPLPATPTATALTDAAPGSADSGLPPPEAWPPGSARPAALPAATMADADGATVPGTTPAVGATATEATGLPAPAGAARDAREARDARDVAPTEPGRWQQAQAAAVLADGLAPTREGFGRGRAEALTEGTDRSLAPLGVAAPGTSGLTAPAASAKTADVAQASLATPATSPEFRAALGAQVSIFARAGVQQAELHLNPAEMGPVSIQIVLDGQQAQVNFGADSALTRQIIESGMPELAGALRDAGLTLTGGGVSQHAGGQRQDADGQGGPGAPASNVNSDTAADATAATPAEQVRRSALRIAQGGVDLYA